MRINSIQRPKLPIQKLPHQFPEEPVVVRKRDLRSSHTLAASARTNKSICVRFPDPSIPSMTMNFPRSGMDSRQFITVPLLYVAATFSWPI